MTDPADTVTIDIFVAEGPPPAPPAAGRERGGVAERSDDSAADLPIPAPLPAWRRALEAATQADPRGRAGVAERIGVSRVYVSRVMSGDISPVPAKFVDRVVATLCRVDCPHLGRDIAPDECRRYAARPYRALAAAEVAHWRDCQRCPNRAPPEAPPTSSFGPDAAERARQRAAERAAERAAALAAERARHQAAHRAASAPMQPTGGAA